LRTVIERNAVPPFPWSSSRLAFLVLAALALRAAFERGLRGFFLRVFPSHDTASHTETSEHSSATAKRPASNAG
jgi:hypothetical protein